MNRYPIMLYKAPGPHAIHGGMFDYVVAPDQSAEAELIGEGWTFTTAEAKAAHEAAQTPLVPAAAPLVDPEPAQDENAPPTRAELEQQAAKLGIKVDGRWGDKRIAAEIEAAMKG